MRRVYVFMLDLNAAPCAPMPALHAGRAAARPGSVPLLPLSVLCSGSFRGRQCIICMMRRRTGCRSGTALTLGVLFLHSNVAETQIRHKFMYLILMWFLNKYLDKSPETRKCFCFLWFTFLQLLMCKYNYLNNIFSYEWTLIQLTTLMCADLWS